MLLRRAARALARPSLPAASFARRGIGESSGLEAIADRGVVRFDAFAGQAGVTTAVDAFASWGFTVNGVALRGSVLLLPSASLLFAPARLEALTPASLQVLTLLESRTDLLIVGTGRHAARLPAATSAWLGERGIAAESMPTQHACSTFNFAVQEQRAVAAVLFPLGNEAKAHEYGAEPGTKAF